MTHPPLEVPFIPARWHGGAQKPEGIVVHGTVSPCVPGQARNTGDYFRRGVRKSSAHYTVDPGETIQSVADHVVAYHCGYNTGTIAFELCDPQAGDGDRWSDRNHTLMLDRAAHDIAVTCLAYDIEIVHPSVASLKARGPHGIYGHVDSRQAFGRTTHSDPGPDFPWARFIKGVQFHADQLTSTPSRPLEPTMTPALTFKATVLAACQRAKTTVPASRVAVHAARVAIAKFAGTIR